MAKPKKKKSATPGICGPCGASPDGAVMSTRLPDTIQFGAVVNQGRGIIARFAIRLACGYCGVAIESSDLLRRLSGITLRSQVMADRANAKKEG